MFRRKFPTPHVCIPANKEWIRSWTSHRFSSIKTTYIPPDTKTFFGLGRSGYAQPEADLLLRCFVTLCAIGPASASLSSPESSSAREPIAVLDPFINGVLLVRACCDSLVAVAELLFSDALEVLSDLEMWRLARAPGTCKAKNSLGVNMRLRSVPLLLFISASVRG